MSRHDHHHHAQDDAGDPASDRIVEHGIARHPDTPRWDAVYAEADQVWSGEPNGVLVVEAAGLAPGRALDVGCGEGADAVWLATRGWRVTAIDPSGVALDRGRAAAAAAWVDVTWVQDGLAGSFPDALPHNDFDLVISFYGVLHHDTSPVDALADLVAPGGTLLVVHHADIDRERAKEHGVDPDELMSPDDVAVGLGDDWVVQVHERRGRQVSGGAGEHHHADVVVRASRR
jgi:SAM-dependent methyltransferase